MWLGGICGINMTDEQQTQYPGITKLGKLFTDFQNSPYMGEWNQKLPTTAGELRTALLETAELIKNQSTMLSDWSKERDTLTNRIKELSHRLQQVGLEPENTRT